MTHRGWTRRISPLWWAMPLAFVVALVPFGAASFAVCGFSGCRRGASEVPDVPFGLLSLAASGAVLALPLVLTHWHPRLATRVAVGVGVAITWTALSAAWMFSQV